MDVYFKGGLQCGEVVITETSSTTTRQIYCPKNYTCRSNVQALFELNLENMTKGNWYSRMAINNTFASGENPDSMLYAHVTGSNYCIHDDICNSDNLDCTSSAEVQNYNFADFLGKLKDYLITMSSEAITSDDGNLFNYFKNQYARPTIFMDLKYAQSDYCNKFKNTELTPSENDEIADFRQFYIHNVMRKFIDFGQNYILTTTNKTWSDYLELFEMWSPDVEMTGNVSYHMCLSLLSNFVSCKNHLEIMIVTPNGKTEMIINAPNDPTVVSLSK